MESCNGFYFVRIKLIKTENFFGLANAAASRYWIVG